MHNYPEQLTPNVALGWAAVNDKSVVSCTSVKHVIIY